MQSLSKKIFIVFFLIISFFLGGIFFLLQNQTVDFSVLENYNPGRPSILYDDTGKEWGRFQLDRREYISLYDMPESIIHAFLSTEDHQFFKHKGLSLKGIFRSLLVNVYHGKKVQGASTITQQLVRLLFFDAKKTFYRKVKEQIFSILVEIQFTKEQILETYLNHVYFGHGIYGVEAAAQRFWNKHACQLSLDESAMLAGMVRAPMYYSPILSPLSAQKRRNLVLSLMHKRDFIDGQECLQAQNRPVTIIDFEKDVIAPHLKETIRCFLEDFVGKQQLYSGGLAIQTTINMTIQKEAERAFHDHLVKIKETLGSDLDGGLTTIESVSGEIKALVGGYNFQDSKFNRALQAKRQMGSIFKPLVYAAAVEKGASLQDTALDEPLEIDSATGTWRPRNNTRKFAGIMTFARALSYSNNIVTIKAFFKAGAKHVIDFARRCYLSGSMSPYPSLSLGCVDGTTCEAVGMFNVFANHGIYVQPHYLRWVKDGLGTKIYKHDPIQKKACSSKVADQIMKVLTLGMVRLQRAIGKTWFGGDAMGKTGTTNDSRTCWFCGATPEFTTALYIGTDDNRSMGKRVYGVRTAFPIWFAMHKALDRGDKKFYYDPSLKEVMIDWKTGQLSSDQNNSEVVSILVE